MIDIGPNLRAWANAEARLDPIVSLYEIDVSDSETLYLIEGDPTGTGSITYDGKTYLACAIKRDDVEQSIEGDLGLFRLSISNVSGVAGGYVEREDLDGRDVRITSIPAALLRAGGSIAASDILEETYSILGQTYNRQAVTLTIGPPNFFRRSPPWSRAQRQRCRWVYGDRYKVGNRCGYPSDEFSSDTVQNFLAGAHIGGPLARLYGWWSLGIQRATAANVDLSVPGALYLEATGDGIDWSPGALEAPFVFKRIDGDFDVVAEVAVSDSRLGSIAGILAQEHTENVVGGDSWAYVGIVQEDAGRTVRGASALAGVGLEDVVLSDPTGIYTRLRLTRVGDLFTFRASTDGTTWTTVGTKTVAFPLGSAVRLGLVLGAPDLETGPIAVSFPYFRFLAGGDATCDRTLEACLAKGNAHRFGAFPGIPRR